MQEYINKVVHLDWEVGIKNIPDNSIDLVVTDPPYGMSWQSNVRKVKHKKIVGDDNLEWLPNWVEQLKRVTKDDSHLYIFCSWHKIEVFKQEVSKHFRVKNILIWDKKNGGKGDLFGDYAPIYEMILFCSNGKRKLNGKRDDSILRQPKTGNNEHPTQKPVNLISYLIEKSSEKGELVLDTFAGSFSTAQAARQKQRNFICFEIDEEYCNKGRQLLEGTTPSLF